MRAWFVTLLLLAVPAFADTYSLFVPENPDPNGIFSMSGAGFPYTIEIYTPGAVPEASHRWSVEYGHGAARGVPHPGQTEAWNPNLGQYGITPPDGWDLVAVNEDATLALIVPAPADITYDTIFENGYLKEGQSIRILPIATALIAALNETEPNMLIGKPSLGHIVCGTDDVGRILASRHTLAANENVRFCSGKPGTSHFEIELREGSGGNRFRVTTQVTPNSYIGTFSDDPVQGKMWTYNSAGRAWYWGHNANSRLTRVSVEIQKGGKRICRSILIPNSNPTFNGAISDCSTVPIGAKVISYAGTCPFRPGPSPVIHGSQPTGIDGKYSIELPYPWVGSFNTAEVQACPPIP